MVESNNMSKRLMRVFLILILFAVGFHASGLEMAFCDDAGSRMLEQAHGCTVCQPSQHVFIAQHASVDFPNLSVSFLNQQPSTLPTNKQASLFLRPPISL